VPEGLVKWLGVRARPVDPAIADARPADATVHPPERPKPTERRMPVKFAYVKVPNDTPTTPNPHAALLSDRDRRARQEVPTPPDATQFTRDPHSVGDSIDRVRPDPTLAEGPDAPAPSGPQVEKPADQRAGLAEGAGAGVDPSQKDADAAAEAEEADGSAGDATIVRDDLVPPNGETGTTTPPDAGGAGGPGSRPTGGRRSSAAPGGARQPADLKPRTEYKFQFNNPGWLKGGGYGTMSFDTQGFPWGDYARMLYVAIRNAWFERIPLAAREGIAGYTCQHFMIARDGAISDLDVVRPSEVPPFTKAASDAIRAASPLPPLPDDFPKSEEGVTFCFYYNMYPGEAD
jgi:TonB family protein